MIQIWIMLSFAPLNANLRSLLGMLRDDAKVRHVEPESCAPNVGSCYAAFNNGSAATGCIKSAREKSANLLAMAFTPVQGIVLHSDR